MIRNEVWIENQDESFDFIGKNPPRLTLGLLSLSVMKYYWIAQWIIQQFSGQHLGEHIEGCLSCDKKA